MLPEQYAEFRAAWIDLLKNAFFLQEPSGVVRIYDARFLREAEKPQEKNFEDLFRGDGPIEIFALQEVLFASLNMLAILSTESWSPNAECLFMTEKAPNIASYWGASFESKDLDSQLISQASKSVYWVQALRKAWQSLPKTPEAEARGRLLHLLWDSTEGVKDKELVLTALKVVENVPPTKEEFRKLWSSMVNTTPKQVLPPFVSSSREEEKNRLFSWRYSSGVSRDKT